MIVSAQCEREDVEGLDCVVQGRTIDWPRNGDCGIPCLIECSNVPDDVDGMLMKILTIGVTGVDKCVKLVCKVNSLGVEFDLAGE
jgi:hypothetical protein